MKTNHKLGPFDMTSMLYCALRGFRFEMLDEMIFIRTYASTLKKGTEIEEILDALDDALKQFFLIAQKDEINNLLIISTRIKAKPLALNPHCLALAALSIKRLILFRTFCRAVFSYSPVSRSLFSVSCLLLSAP